MGGFCLRRPARFVRLETYACPFSPLVVEFSRGKGVFILLSAGEIQNYWCYFQSLDRDLNKTRFYVEHKPFCALDGEKIDNSSTFSIQFYKLLFSASTEFETIAKLLCKEIDGSFKDQSNIVEISKTILRQFPKIVDTEVYNNYGLFKPLAFWGVNEDNKVIGLDWWRAYTSLKHNRELCYQAANLNNVINALASLLVIELYLTLITQSTLDLAVDIKLEYFGFPYGPQPFYVQRAGSLPDF